MPSARIFRPSRDATQSGLARTKQWLMGWNGSSDMMQQVRLEFDTEEEAVAYAKREGIAYRVEQPAKPAARKGLSYSDNFKFNRTAPWTH
jgi:hypothetical protein